MLQASSRAAFCVSVICSAVLAACGGGGSSESTPVASSKDYAQKVASCQTSDHPETALQGQVPAALRTAGFKGFNCNLELVGQLQGEGGSWSTATITDGAGHRCMYHATGTPGPSPLWPPTVTPSTRVNPGVPVIDITDPTHPVRTTSLTTKAMMDPWESLRINHRRQFLIADNGSNAAGDSTVDLYDLSGDCRSPQLLASFPVGTGNGLLPSDAKGHEGGVSPDGLTYYIGDPSTGRYDAIDISNTTTPKMIASVAISDVAPADPAVGIRTSHGLSVSEDGNRMYGVILGIPNLATLGDATVQEVNGFGVFDTSEVQQRKPNPTIKLISKTLYKDGSGAQHTIPITIAGKPYLVMVDEGGSGGPIVTSQRAACAAGATPFPMARLFDISDESKPKLVSKLALETHDPKNCDAVMPDIAGLTNFTYGSHYCTVDNRTNATALACGYFNSGIRVFDIRNPEAVKEIAYYNPAGATTPSPGSNHNQFGEWKSGWPDWCASRFDFDYASKQITTMCQDNGALVLKFAPGTWPFAESVASTNQN